MQAKILSAVESDVLDFLEKGAGAETLILGQIKALLPENIAQQIPTPTVPTAPIDDAYVPYTADSYSDTNYSGTSTVVTDISEVEPPMPTRDAQTAAALVELRTAVAASRSCIDQYADNADPTRFTMLRINILEARDRLSMRIQEIESSTTITSELALAIDEAKALVEDISSEL